jgi:hypothetical protein
MPRVNENSIHILEGKTMKKASRLISKLEIALAKWNNEIANPPGYEDRFRNYEILLGQVTNWQKRMLRSRGRNESMETRLRRLREYANILQSHKR